VLQSSDRRRNTNSYRCRHVIVANVRESHFRFRSSSTALVVAHRRRSIRVRLQPSSVLQSSDRRREIFIVADTSLSSTCVEVISVSGRRRQHWSSVIVAAPYWCGSSHRQCYSRAIDGVIRTVTVVDTSSSPTCVKVISVSGRRRQHWSSLIVAVPYGCGSSHRQCYSRAIDGMRYLSLPTRHCRERAWKLFPLPVVVDSIGRRSSSPFHIGAAPAIVSATVERSTA
jgi:hypothetical protein